MMSFGFVEETEEEQKVLPKDIYKKFHPSIKVAGGILGLNYELTVFAPVSAQAGEEVPISFTYWVSDTRWPAIVTGNKYAVGLRALISSKSKLLQQFTETDKTSQIPYGRAMGDWVVKYTMPREMIYITSSLWFNDNPDALASSIPGSGWEKLEEEASIVQLSQVPTGLPTKEDDLTKWLWIGGGIAVLGVGLILWQRK